MTPPPFTDVVTAIVSPDFIRLLSEAIDDAESLTAAITILPETADAGAVTIKAEVGFSDEDDDVEASVLAATIAKSMHYDLATLRRDGDKESEDSFLKLFDGSRKLGLDHLPLSARVVDVEMSVHSSNPDITRYCVTLKVAPIHV